MKKLNFNKKDNQKLMLNINYILDNKIMRNVKNQLNIYLKLKNKHMNIFKIMMLLK